MYIESTENQAVLALPTAVNAEVTYLECSLDGSGGATGGANLNMRLLTK